MKKKRHFGVPAPSQLSIQWGGLWWQEEKLKELLPSLLVINKLPTVLQVSDSRGDM